MERDFRSEWDYNSVEVIPPRVGEGIEVYSLWIIDMLDEIDRLRARVKELEKDGEDYRSYIDTLMGQRVR